MGQDKILILGSKESFIIRVLLKKLADAGIDAEFTTLSVEKINDYWEDISLVTFYMEQDERLDDEIRTFLVDKMEDDDKQIILIGEPNDTDDVAKGIPSDLIFEILPRPLDYSNYINIVNTYTKKASTGELKKSILVVDDDPNYMNLVREWLKDTYRVSMATSGLRAIKWLGANKVDLILLDYEMPVTDGPQVLEMLRADDDTKDIPVMFLTGRDDKESVMAVVSLKPEGYFLKTIGKDELLNKLKIYFMSKE
ncbi:Response regulator receiver domain-containing protein [Pseudobutyrivibrio sp. JW11]|uniref:response regulator n=1 Tax=Pseudobutyrivibrio TaxID=46205 RepID=UPI0008EBA641|nr:MULTISPECIES: response regulator [Pseudobutyrivibrio]MBE5913365.1 response regulator [Pseudobutyrivibrio ruminis]SFO12559.1 Response regulator receiver domain-containing protein [Pseudobutyrivibrio sp. JW11]